MTLIHKYVLWLKNCSVAVMFVTIQAFDNGHSCCQEHGGPVTKRTPTFHHSRDKTQIGLPGHLF